MDYKSIFNTIYGTLIFFFYFIKYPVVIFLPIAYFYLDYPNSHSMNALAFISIVLIFKDWIYPHKKPENCSGKKCNSKSTSE